jgi:hypothetical protein
MLADLGSERSRVGGKEGDLGGFKMGFVGGEEAIEPGEEFVGAVVRVEDDEAGLRPSISEVWVSGEEGRGRFHAMDLATARTWCAAAMAPTMLACCWSFARPLPE